MKRLVPLLLIAFALVVAACGGGSADTSLGETVPEADLADGSTSSVTVRPGGTIDGPAAPDFTLALGPDAQESFTLSDAAMPVYMVFWAEW